jgi:hypothetical protein
MSNAKELLGKIIYLACIVVAIVTGVLCIIALLGIPEALGDVVDGNYQAIGKIVVWVPIYFVVVSVALHIAQKFGNL